MASRLPATSVHMTKAIKPFLSTNRIESKRRVMNLYRAWIRFCDRMPYVYDIPRDVGECKAAIKTKFLANKDIKDLRTVDYLVAKGQMDLIETKEIWSQKHHVMTRLFDGELTKPERPKEGDFMAAFLAGKQDA